MTTFSLLQSLDCTRLVETLIHFLWQGTLATVFVAIAAQFLRRRSPSLRYGVFATALVVMALCPPVTILLLGADPSPAPILSEPVSTPEASPNTMIPSRPETVMPAAIHPTAAVNSVSPAPMTLAERFRAIPWPEYYPYAIAVYLAGVTAMLLRLILAHELAHIRRYDHLVNLLQRLIEAFLFFHPGIWYVSRRLRVERELCCDDCVLAAGGNPADYADSLVRIAELCLAARTASLANVAALGAADRPNQLRCRIFRLLGMADHEQVRLTRVWGLAVLMFAAVIVVSVVLGSSNPTDQKPVSQSPPKAASLTSNAALTPGILPSLPITLVEVKTENGVSSFRWRISRNGRYPLHAGCYSFDRQGIREYTGDSRIEAVRGDIEIKLTVRPEEGAVRLIREYFEGGKTIKTMDGKLLIPKGCILRESHLAEPTILTDVRDQTLWEARVIYVHEHGTQYRSTLRYVIKAFEPDTVNGNFQPPTNPLPVPSSSPFSVYGTVTDAAGRPVYGATVRVATGIGTLLGRSETITGGDGRYRLWFGPGILGTDKNKGGYVIPQAAVVCVSKDGWYEADLCRQGNLAMADTMPDDANDWKKHFHGVVLPHRPFQVDFSLRPAAMLKGTLVNQKNEPLGNRDFTMDGKDLYPATSSSTPYGDSP